jgi:hypothetical protein
MSEEQKSKWREDLVTFVRTHREELIAHLRSRQTSDGQMAIEEFCRVILERIKITSW